MYIFKNKISIEHRDELQPYLDGFEYETSGLSFSGLYMWRESNQFCYEKIGEYMCISAISHLEIDEELHFMFPPLTNTGEYDRESLRYTILEAERIFKEKGEAFSMRLVPGHMIDILKDAVPEMEFVDDRPNYDYVYDRFALQELKGKKYHAKKNYINSFKANFEYEYESIDSSMTEEIMEYIRKFSEKKNLEEHEMELLKMEEEAMRDVFEHFEEAGYMGGVIRIDGDIQALTAGGRIGKGGLVQHIEKANTEFRGLYPMIMNEFLKHIPEDIEYVNREEDMGMENLRKAKLSYRPVKLLDKYIGIIR